MAGAAHHYHDNYGEEDVVAFLESKGDFPLRRLMDRYHISFNEEEVNLIQKKNKLFWLMQRDYCEDAPPSFVGTPYELWGMMQVWYMKHKTRRYDESILQYSLRTGEELVSTNYTLQYHNIFWSIRDKIMRHKSDFLLDFEIITYRNLVIQWRRDKNEHSNPHLRTSAFMGPYLQPSLVGIHFDNDLRYAAFNEEERDIIQLTYTQNIYNDILGHEDYLEPLPTEGTRMEIWLILYIMRKGSHTMDFVMADDRDEDSRSTIDTIFYMRYGREMNDEDLDRIRQTENNIVRKLSKRNYDNSRAKEYAFRLGSSKSDRNNSIAKKLPMENIDHICEMLRRLHSGGHG
jgi:hypothetical protein